MSRKTIEKAPEFATYHPYALALNVSDSVLVAGNNSKPYLVCGYDTASLLRLWIVEVPSLVSAVALHGDRAFVMVPKSSTLVLDITSGGTIGELPSAFGDAHLLSIMESKDRYCDP